MANSKYEYVRAFEREEYLLPNTWIVVRIDGRGFHKLSKHYSFTKPNDIRALSLMNVAATHTLKTITDICFAYGVSDEYSFIFERDTKLFERRKDKIISTVVSTFTAAYIYLWPNFFSTSNQASQTSSTADSSEPTPSRNKDLDPSFLPTFDARAILYPTTRNLRDYLSWRQVDCHINNLYNTTFWALVQKGGMGARDAEELLKGTVSSDKNEILFVRFGVNYNDEKEIFRKGTAVYRAIWGKGGEKVTDGDGGEKGDGRGEKELSKTQSEKMRKRKLKAEIVVEHVDIIKDEFWDRSWILGRKEMR